MTDAEFDAYATAEDYRAALDKGLKLSGEGSDYFARARIERLRERLEAHQFTPRDVLDFGCGNGGSLPLFFEIPGAQKVTGADVSAASLQVAREANRERGEDLELCRVTQLINKPAAFDLAFTNGVFHHIPLAEREENLALVYQSLRPGGLFAFWENNPLNPLVVYAMKKVPFDAEAVTIVPALAEDLLERAGFELLETHFLFFFPKTLAALRRFEPALRHLPLGGQYLKLCRKPH